MVSLIINNSPLSSFDEAMEDAVCFTLNSQLLSALPSTLYAFFTFVLCRLCNPSPSLNLPTGQVFNARSCLLS